MRVGCFIFLYYLFLVAAAQNPLGARQSKKSESLHLFDKGEFSAVIQLIGKDPVTLEEKYLVRMSEVHLSQEQPDLLKGLVKANPKYYLNSQANFALGQYQFYRGKMEVAERSLKAIDASALSEMKRAEYYFMRGYIAMQNKQYKAAQNYLQRAEKLQTGKSNELTYYQGFISYHLNQKDATKELLSKVVEDPEFGTSAKFFISKMSLEDKQYDEVIRLAQSELSDERSVTNSEFNQLVGEAYALQDQASKASNYFEKALDLHPGTPSAALYYQAGVANFKINLREKAVRYLTEAGIRSGDYAHLSAFQLGRLYVASEDKEKAVSAYIEASASSDMDIQEESVFMAGKLLLDNQNYSEGIKYLQDYRTGFVEGKWRVETEELLAEAYLRTSNYDQAIDHLREIGVASAVNKVIYQKVTFQKAYLLFNDGRFGESIEWFAESLKYPEDRSLQDDAYHNRAEAYFNLSQFDLAVRSYKMQSTLSPESLYGLGYTYFNLFKYKECIDYFEQFQRSNPSAVILRDAELRLADAYYGTKQYEKALGLYGKLSHNQPSTYLTYQVGIVNRNLDRKEKAVAAFEQVLKMEPDTLTDDAILQIAQIRFESAQFEQAEFRFGSLIAKYPSSSRIPEAYLNRAICRTNLNKLQEAKSDFEFIVNNHLDSKVAFNAILGLQELQSKGLEVNDIQELIARYRELNPNDGSLEVVEFEYAKSQYFDLKYKDAVEAFQKFIKNYAGSSYLSEAKYYLADSYYRDSNLEQARERFREIAEVRNEFSGRVHTRLGDINFQLERYDDALSSYRDLIDLALSPKDNYNGQNGLMKAYYAKEGFENCLRIADIIIAAEWKPLNAERNALLTKGRCYIQLEDLDQAELSLRPLTEQSDRISAEASFLIAKMQSSKGEYQNSLDLFFAFNSKFGSYQDLIDQSYLQIANNYILMGDLFQAKATLRSILQHSDNEPLKEQASNQLNLIELQQPEDSIINKQ
ncbi:MAG: tetratricopeptide repeat protein [Cyclobacteriaceae bacterium]